MGEAEARSQQPAAHAKGGVADVCRSVGATPGRPVKEVLPAMLRMAGVFAPAIRELREIDYQFTRPFVMDSSAVTKSFGLTPTPWDEVCRRTAPRRSSA